MSLLALDNSAGARGSQSLPVSQEKNERLQEKNERLKVNSSNVLKGIGTAAVVVGGLSVITVIVLAALSATGKGPNVLDMGKPVNVSFPGAMAKTSGAALGIFVAGSLGLGLLGLGGVLIHQGRKKSAEEKAAENERSKAKQRAPTLTEIRLEKYAAFKNHPTGTNKKWVGGILGVTAAIVGAAMIVLVVVPLFKNMPQVNHMGNLHTAVSSSGVHGIVISTGAIVTFSIGAASALTGIVSAIIFALGVRNANKKADLERDYLTADQNEVDQKDAQNSKLSKAIRELEVLGVNFERDENNDFIFNDGMLEVNFDAITKAAQREVISAAEAKGVKITNNGLAWTADVSKLIQDEQARVAAEALKKGFRIVYNNDKTVSVLLLEMNQEKTVVVKEHTIQDVNNLITKLNGDISNAQNEVTRLQGELANAKSISASQVQSLNEELAASKKQVAELNEKLSQATAAKEEAVACEAEVRAHD